MDGTGEENKSVTLTVPAAVATEGKHKGPTTWTLYNTPDGTEQEPLNDSQSS
ncbi:hypothetical protein [Aerococcus sp. HMSC10H05]|uniref:hypothetical protein n=1 Tax=Aerococcus sp. HMSC10H05 TaxID=1581084 RepID=UPI00143A4A0C|nr:hypothetical protein [Aerococcus sp. HMSC10H05]